MKHPISPLLFASLLWFSVACGDATSDDLGSVNPSTGGSAGAAGNGLAGGAVAGAAGGPAGTGGDAGTAGAAGGGGTGGGTAGSGAGGDAGSGQGGAGGAICGGDFPAPDKTCASKQDCAWAMHTANCCGSEVAVGFNKNYAAQFGETEQAWDACLPGCGCAADPPSAEDGKMIGNGTVEVSCNAGQCETSVVASAGCCPAQGCPAGTQCAGGVKCEPPAQAGQCWTDQECADGATCEGASMCPCDAFCDEEDHPGVCKKNGLAPGECRGQPDCKSDELTCAPPGTSMGCGICMLPEYPCSSDAECTPLGATMICGISDPCVCGLGCVPGCTSDADCGEGEACGGDHHCSPKTCQNDGECTSNFACNGGTCQRRTCKSDEGCSGGYCVLGLCYTSAGVCLGPPPP